MPNRFSQFAQESQEVPGSEPQPAPFQQNRFAGYATQGVIPEYMETGKRRSEALSAQMGDQFDPSDTFSGSFMSEMDIARSAAPEDRLAKFREAFPEGEMQTIQTAEGPVEVARSNPNEPFRELRIGPAVAGALASEPVVGGVVGSLAGPVGTAVGTGVGVLAQQGIEQSRGYGGGEGGAGRAIGEGVLGGAVDAVTRGVSRLVRGPRMPQAQRESMLRAVDAAKDLGLEPLTIGQTSPSPFTRGMFRQVGVTSPKVEQTVGAQEASLLDHFRREIAAGGVEGVSDDALNTIVKAQQRELSQIISPKVLNRTDAGEALQQGIETYRQTSREAVNRLYERAIAEADDVAFNVAPAQEVAKDIQRGVQGRGVGGKSVALAETPEGALKAVVDDLLALDPQMMKFSTKGGEWDAFSQIKTLRTRLFDLRESSEGGVRREANRLWNELTKVMDNPISGDPNFVSAYKQASRANAIREENLGKSFVAQALRTDTPEVLARKYLMPGKATELEAIRKLVPKEHWEDFRQAFQADLVRSPNASGGLRRLDTFEATDPKGLRMILEPGEEKALREYLSTKARFEASPANKILEKNLTDGERMVGMVKSGSAQDVADTVRLAGGRNSPTAQSMKAGIYKDILDSSMDVSTAGTDVLDAGKLMSNIQKWRASGKLDALMEPHDWKALESLQSYAAPLAETADVGGGMMGGALRQQAIHAPTETLTGDVKKVARNVFRPLYSNAITARMLTIPASRRRLMRGTKARKLPIREGAVALALMERELQRTEGRGATSVITEGIASY